MSQDNLPSDVSAKTAGETGSGGVERYSYSYDQETYVGEEASRDAALEMARDANPGRTVWTGRNVSPELRSLLPSAHTLIDEMRDRAYDEAGEFAEDWLDDVTKEQESELRATVQAAVTAWLDKHNHHPRWWTVTDVQEHAPSSPTGET